jgi:hypothetical protein
MTVWTALHRICEVGEQQFYSEYEILEPRKRKWEFPDKIPLNNTDGGLILAAHEEIKRQPLMDYKGEYDNEVEIKCIIGGKKVKWTLDRFCKKKKLIRDYKCIANVQKFKSDYVPEWGFDYYLSWAFYWLLAKEKYWIECDIIFDVVDKTTSHASGVFYIKPETIKPHVERVKEALKLFKKTRTFKPTTERYKCLKCAMYSVCKKSIQKHPEEITNESIYENNNM